MKQYLFMFHIFVSFIVLMLHVLYNIIGVISHQQKYTIILKTFIYLYINILCCYETSCLYVSFYLSFLVAV
jgi:hypothetical protein